MQYVLNVKVLNIKCASCISSVEQAVLKNGANRFEFNFETNTVKVYFEGKKNKSDELIKAINDAGYPTENPFVMED
jgi:copper chaperone CopZ